MNSQQLARPTDQSRDSASVIEHVAVRRLSRAVQPLISGIHNISSVELNVVELYSGGHAGIGYCYAFSAREADAVTPLILHIAEVLLGRDLAHPSGHQPAMWRRINFVGRSGPPVMALSALDVALWDLCAQSAGLPLHALLGASGSQRGVYAAGGSRALDMRELVAEAVRFKAMGYAGYKLRVGGDDWREDVRRVTAVHEALGGEIALMIDANQAWSAEIAIRAAEALAPLQLAWLEEPVDGEDFAAMAAVRERAPMPIAAGETIYGAAAFERMIDAQAADVLQPDLMRCGGISGFLQIAEMAERAGLAVAPHLFCEIVAQLPSRGEAAALVEYLPGWFDGLFDGAVSPVGGTLTPGTAPGLGLSLSHAALAEQTIATVQL